MSNTGSPKTKASKSDISKPAHVKMDAHKSPKPHSKTIQETADEMKPTGFKTSREIASPDTPEINAQELDIAEAKQTPDTVVSGSSQVDPSTQVSPVVSPASAPQAAVPTSDAETPSTSTDNTAKNQTATATESGGGFNPFGPIRSVFQPIIDVAASVRDQIRPVIGAALSPVLGPLSPGKGGATQNVSATTVAQPSTSEGSATSPANPTGVEEPHRETQTVVPAETASSTTVQDSAAPEVRTHETGAETDAKTVALPALEANRNGSQTPLSPFPALFDPVAAINRFTKPAVDAATNVRDQVRPAFEAAVAPIVDALNPTKEAADSNATVVSSEPQLRASDDMTEIAAEEPMQPHKRRYSNYKLFTVYIGNDTTTLDVISALRENTEVDFWSAPTLNRNVSILIPPGLIEKVENILKNAGIEYHIITDDIQRWIDREEEENQPGVFLEQRDITHYAFDKYHRVEEITGYLDLLAQKHSHIATVRNIGMTQEGRPIKGVILSTGSNRPVLWFDGGIHAREWVSPASLLYFLHKMTTGYGSDSTITTILQTFDFYIFPVVNPDGYAYTFTSDRLWRKNRSGGRRGCRGVDPNRNFASAFGGAGTSGHPCSDIYRGGQAFSEAESRAIRDAILELGSRIKGYVTVHSYSQLIMVPYGHGRGTYTRDYADQMSAARAVSRAIQVRSGVYYQVGTISSLLGPAAGSSSDWVYDGAKIKYSIAVELRDKGRYGFLLPNFLIVPTADEASEGFKALAKFIARRELNKSIY
ncbi:zinc carboxypeptidase A 1-like [Dermacentor albipictus]|uniref:zinc carboxypeptidase A 1-like n=1 Tax=Dermacentor albipictus TaxID=60249 RepID=UPI0038FC2B99